MLLTVRFGNPWTDKQRKLRSNQLVMGEFKGTNSANIMSGRTLVSRFRDSEDEAAFLRHVGRETCRWSRGSLLLIALYLGALSALLLYQLSDSRWTIVLVPAVSAGLLLALRGFATSERYARMHQFILVHAIAFSGIGLLLILLLAPEALNSVISSLVLLTVAAFALLPLIFAFSLIAIGLLVLAVVVILLLSPGIDYSAVAGHLTMLTATYALGAIIGFGIEGRRRQAFLQKRELEMRNREVAWAGERAAAADRAKSDFLATMSHEIRTPINGVLGTARLLLKKGGLSDEVDEALQIIDRSGEALRRQIDDALDITVIEAGRSVIQNKRFRLMDAIAEALDTLRPLAKEHGLGLDLTTSDDLPEEIVGDEGRLRQVVLNLVGNAVKFTDEGGIAVTVEPVTVLAHRARLRITVEDTGIGIAPEDQTRIFEALTTGANGDSKHYGGTGLGLAIAQRLVAEMGGEISVTSEVGVGTTFFFEADFIVPDDTLDSMPSKPEMTGDRNQLELRLLLVEDDPASRYVITGFLELDGHKVTAVGTGKAAIATLAAEKFDAVLMDLQLPDFSGLELLDRIRLMTEQSDIPVIVVTANILPDTVKTCMARGATDVIEKPIDPDQLAESLDGFGPTDARQPPRRLGVEIPHAFDQETFVTLLDVCGAGRVLLLMKDFELAMHGHAEELTKALRSKNNLEAARAVHKLAGASACYGATKLADASRNLEHVLRDDGGSDTIDRLHWELEVALNDLEPALGTLGAALERAATGAKPSDDEDGDAHEPIGTPNL